MNALLNDRLWPALRRTLGQWVPLTTRTEVFFRHLPEDLPQIGQFPEELSFGRRSSVTFPARW